MMFGGKLAAAGPSVIVRHQAIRYQGGRGGAMPANRAYGMDQDFYPWSPIVTRPILRWPGNARVALAVIVNLEHWDWEVPAGTPLAVSPLGGPGRMWTRNPPDLSHIA